MSEQPKVGIRRLGEIELHGHHLVDSFQLSCGCVFGNELETQAFCVEPCSPGCTYYRYMLEETRRQGKGVMVDEGRSN